MGRTKDETLRDSLDAMGDVNASHVHGIAFGWDDRVHFRWLVTKQEDGYRVDTWNAEWIRSKTVTTLHDIKESVAQAIRNGACDVHVMPLTLNDVDNECWLVYGRIKRVIDPQDTSEKEATCGN